MTLAESIQFRIIDDNDISEIVTIHNSNVRGENNTHNSGFLLAKTNQEEIQAKINKGTFYFVVVDINNQILGFVAVSKPEIMIDGNSNLLDMMIWDDESYKIRLLEDNHFYIQTVATKQEYMGKGIAQFMYQSLFDRFPNYIFSAFIVSKPIFNERSIKFHQQQGFLQVAKIQLDEFLDMKNYESVLMVKENI
ncbi:MAG: GNAT family N-acetyltransferase [Nostocales cyanobacterium]|nr:MAG: GNAT family N-acetyltransferase [Nostocales cyanobacterium]